jgi:Fe-S-cluster containining protein
MNGSGANVAGCATCHGRCCREYRVEVTVADVRTIAAGTTLRPSDFIKLRQSDKDGRGFRLQRGGPSNELNLIRRSATGGCVFLMEISPTQARCGVYAHRPMVCRNFPTNLVRGAVAVRGDVTCGPNSWSLAAMDLPGYRRDLVQRDADWKEHWRIVEEWNSKVDASRQVAAPEDLYAFLLNHSPAPKGQLAATGG